MLPLISLYYSYYEKISILSNTTFNTSDYDALLLNNTKQKALISLFKKMDENIDWDTRYKVVGQISRINMLQPVEEYFFKGNDVYGIRHGRPDAYMGTRDEIIEELIATGEIRKNKKIPDGYRLKAKGITFPSSDFNNKETK
jgi:hypothetical protein